MNSLMEKVLGNSENLYNNSIDTENEYIRFDLTKNMIESYFRNSVILKCMGVQTGNGSDSCEVLSYRQIGKDNATSTELTYPTLSFGLTRNNVKFDINIEFDTVGKQEPEKEIQTEFDRYLLNQLIEHTTKSNHVSTIDISTYSREQILTYLKLAITEDDCHSLI